MHSHYLCWYCCCMFDHLVDLIQTEMPTVPTTYYFERIQALLHRGGLISAFHAKLCGVVALQGYRLYASDSEELDSLRIRDSLMAPKKDYRTS